MKNLLSILFVSSLLFFGFSSEVDAQGFVQIASGGGIVTVEIVEFTRLAKKDKGDDEAISEFDVYFTRGKSPLKSQNGGFDHSILDKNFQSFNISGLPKKYGTAGNVKATNITRSTGNIKSKLFYFKDNRDSNGSTLLDMFVFYKIPKNSVGETGIIKIENKTIDARYIYFDSVNKYWYKTYSNEHCSFTLKFVDANPTGVYLRPIKVTYLNTPKGEGEKKARYNIKIKELEEDWNQPYTNTIKCFGFTGKMAFGASTTTFDNLLPNGDILLQKGLADDIGLTIRFDAWASNRSGSDSYIWNSGTDEEHKDASVKVRLNGTNKVKGKARGDDFEIEFEVYQR